MKTNSSSIIPAQKNRKNISTNLEPGRRPNMRKVYRPKRRDDTPKNQELLLPQELVPRPKLNAVMPLVPKPLTAEPEFVDSWLSELYIKVKQTL